MSEHSWRQGFGIDPMREWMRRELPSARDGMVISDLDVAIRRYGQRYGLDAEGDLRLLEKKEYIGQLTQGQKRVYGWLDQAIASSKMLSRWRGWNVLRVAYKDEPHVCETCNQPIETPDQAYDRFSRASLYLDGKEITHEDFRKWLEEPYFADEPPAPIAEQINQEAQSVSDWLGI